MAVRGVDAAATIDRDPLVNPAPQPTTLGHALNLLIGAAHRYRERLGPAGSMWSFIGHLRQRPADHARTYNATQVRFGCCRVPCFPRIAVTVPTINAAMVAGVRHNADDAITMPPKAPEPSSSNVNPSSSFSTLSC